MTPLDGYTIATLIVTGLLLFATGWRMGRKKRAEDFPNRTSPRRRPF